MKKQIIIFSFLFIFSNFFTFAQFANGDLSFGFGKLTFSSQNSSFSSQGITSQIQYDFFPFEKRKLGFSFGIGGVFPVSNNLKIQIENINHNSSLNRENTFNADFGFVFKEKLNKLSFREKILCSFIAPHGETLKWIDERDLIFSGVFFAPKLSLAAFYSVTPRFYVMSNFSFAYGYGSMKAFINYTEKDSKSKDLYTTNEKSNVSFVNISIGVGFFGN